MTKFQPIEVNRPWIGPRGGKLRVVIIDASYDTIQTELTQQLLGRIMALKIAGYGREYPYGALPVDIGDIIGVHLLVCEELPDGLDPIMGLKSVSGHRCEIHRVEFPAFHLASHDELPRHHEAVRRTVEQIKWRKERYAYSCSWTMAPIVRSDKDLSRLLKNINMSFFVHYYQEYKIPHIFAGATLRFKVEEWKSFLGFRPMALDGEILPDFNCTSFYGEPVRLMYLREFTDEALKFAAHFRPLWDQRLTLDINTALPETAKKAA